MTNLNALQVTVIHVTVCRIMNQIIGDDDCKSFAAHPKPDFAIPVCGFIGSRFYITKQTQEDVFQENTVLPCATYRNDGSWERRDWHESINDFAVTKFVPNANYLSINRGWILKTVTDDDYIGYSHPLLNFLHKGEFIDYILIPNGSTPDQCTKKDLSFKPYNIGTISVHYIKNGKRESHSQNLIRNLYVLNERLPTLADKEFEWENLDTILN